MALAGMCSLAVLATPGLMVTDAHAVAPGSCGSVLLAGSSWLKGLGVAVHSNGSHEGTGVSCSSKLSYVKGVRAGGEWQCVELVNRLYLSRAWIEGHWAGNGDQLYANAPNGLKKQPNGSVSYLAPGDVISVKEYRNGTYEGGHAAVVDASSKVTSGIVSVVSQNSGSPSNATPQRTASITRGAVVYAGGASGKWSYKVVGVIHAPNSATTAKATNHLFAVNSAGTVRETYWKSGGTRHESTSIPAWSGTVGLAAYQSSDGVNHLFAVNSAGTVRETYWKSGGTRHESTSIPAWSGTVGLAAYQSSDGVNHLFAVNSAGTVRETYWKSGGTRHESTSIPAWSGTVGLAAYQSSR